MFNEILCYIVAAQVASDGGKGIEDEKIMFFAYRVYRSAYNAKDRAIEKAIRLLEENKCNGISYYIAAGDDKAPAIVYFEIETMEGIKQISFHCFNNFITDRIGNGKQTSWDTMSSRENCKYLIDKYNLSIEDDMIYELKGRKRRPADYISKPF